MELRITKDVEQINKVFKDPEIYDRISADKAPPISEWEPPLSNAIYLGGFVADEPVAFMVFHPKTSVAWQLHIQVLKQHRERYANEFAESALSWWFKKNPTIKLIAEIPEIYGDVIQFAQKHGFDVDGICYNAYKKNGSLCSIYYLSREAPQ